MYQRIAIIGISATGKSTLTRRLAYLTGLPVFFTDQLWWKKHWQVADEIEVREKLLPIIESTQWIVEGYIEPLSTEKLGRAELVIYLDYSPWRTAWNYLKRWYTLRKKVRLEMPEGCTERFEWERLKVAFFRKERAEIEQVLSCTSGVNLVRIHTPQELEEFVKTLEVEKSMACAQEMIAPFAHCLIKNYTYWGVYVFSNQEYLGRCVVWCLRENALDLTDATPEEMEELSLILKKLKVALEKEFAVDWMNYSFLGNADRHLHGHVVPRYASSRTLLGHTFTDELWGRNWKLNRDFVTPPGVIEEVKKHIQPYL